MKPCPTPEICGVKSHREGTQCKSSFAEPTLTFARDIRFGAPESKVKCSNQGCIGSAIIQDKCVKHGKHLLGQKFTTESKLTELVGYASDIGTTEVDKASLLQEVRELTSQNGGRPFVAREEQLDMTHNLIQELQVNDRAQIRAACGMGKTLVQETTIYEYDKRLQNEQDRSGTYVVLVPSIKLAQQLRSSYQSHGILGLEDEDAFSIHCDPDDSNYEPVDEKELQQFLEDGGDKPRVIFVVNSSESVGKLISAQRESGVEVDMTIYDEAHRYTVGKGTSRINGTMFNSDDNITLNSKTRVFMTATPISKDLAGARGLPSMGMERSIEVYLDTVRNHDGRSDQSNAAKKLQIDMSDQFAFGKMVSSYSLRDAVSKGYLVPPRPYVSAVTVGGRANGETARDSIVDVHGNLNGGNMTMTLGAYQNIASLYDRLSTDDSYSDGGRSNSLSFANTVNECRQISDNWKQVGVSLSTKMNDGQEMSLKDAQIYAHDPHSDKRKAARIRLIAEHSNVMSTSSKHTMSQREAAQSHFDLAEDGMDANGRLKGCDCGQPGRWCPCARVVANYDMFSEGIDISSIDTIVLDRPSRSSESMIVQAVGRSSRMFTNPSTGRVKKQGNVVIPMTYDDDGLTNAEEVSLSSGAMDKMWSDRGEEFYHDNKSPNETLPVSSESLGIPDGTSTSMIQDWYLTDGIEEGAPYQRVAAAKIISDAFGDVLKDWKRDMGIKTPIFKIPMHERVQIVNERVAAGQYTKATKVNQINPIRVLRMIEINERSMSRYNDISKLMGDANSNRIQHLEGHPELRGLRVQSARQVDQIKMGLATENAIDLLRICNIT